MSQNKIPLSNLERVRTLIATGQLTSVSSDRHLLDSVIASATSDLEAANILATTHAKQSFNLAYDASHKALAAFLQAQGWRVQSDKGHHRLLMDVITDEAPALGATMTSLRKALLLRNALAYPTGPTQDPTTRELTELLDAANRLVSGMSQLIANDAIPRVNA